MRYHHLREIFRQHFTAKAFEGWREVWCREREVWCWVGAVQGSFYHFSMLAKVNNTNFHFLTGFIDQVVIQIKIINVKVVELVFWLYDISPCFKLFDESWQRISDFR